MKGLVLALVLTLVGCQNLNRQPVFSQNKCYTYKYEFTQLTRVPVERHSGAGIKLSCKAEICGSQPGLYLMRMYGVDVFEYNSHSSVSEFIPSPKLTKSIAAQLVGHVAFNSENGRIKKVMASADLSVDGVNLYKGFLNNMQPIIKEKQREYTLIEDGIEGRCNQTYVIPESDKANRLLVMKSTNLNECLKRVEKVVGTMYATPCRECKENSQAAITSNYYIKSSEEGSVIDQVIVSEIHRYMPFNEINAGSIVMEASQNIQLIREEQHRPEALPANLKDHGSLEFQFSDELERFSSPSKQLESQIVDDLKYLAQHTWEKISEESTKKYQQLTHLMHKADYELYDSVYKQCSSQPECRKHFWNVVGSANNPNAIRLLKHEYEKQAITDWEAAQIMLIGFHSINPSLGLIEEAKTFLSVVHKDPHRYLFKTSLLAYASLCHKYCIDLNNCPESVLKPLNDFTTEVLTKPNDDDIILMMRAYENVQHQSILKPFMRLLPGIGHTGSSLKVQNAAVRCLKGFARNHPTWVRRTSMQIYQNQKLPDSTRILAAWSLLSTKPDLPILMILAKSLANEPSSQVEHFVISSLHSLATSTASDLQVMASACRMVLNIVSSKSVQPKYAAGKFFIINAESDMAGVKAEVLILNNAGSVVPDFMSTKFETKFLGKRFSPIEMGLGIPNLPDFLGKRRYEAGGDNDRSVDARKLLKMHSEQKEMPRELPHMGGYLKVMGQNVFVGSANLKTIMEEFKNLYRPEHGDSWITNLIYSLQSGVDTQWVKALTSVDASYAVPACTGLLTERRLSHFAITTLAGNVQAWFTPELPSHHDLSKLNPVDIRLKTKLSFSIDKRMNFKMGIRNSLLQAGLEENAKLIVNVPFKTTFDVDIKNKRFKLEIPPCKEETNIFSVSTNTYAVVGTGDQEPATKPIPVLYSGAVPKIINEDFKRVSSQANKLQETSSAQRSASVLPDVCLNASTFGCKACIKYSGVSAGFGNDIFSRFLGEQNIACVISPVHSETPIEKIEVTFQLDNLTAAYRRRDQKTAQRMDRSHERTTSSSREEAENAKETLLASIRSHEAQNQQHDKNHSKNPRKPQSSSSSSKSSSRSSSEISSSSSSDTSQRRRRTIESSSSSENSRRSKSSSSSRSSSPSSSSSSSSSSRSSSENEQEGRQVKRRPGRMSSSDHLDRGDAEREHQTPGKKQSSSSSSHRSSSSSSSRRSSSSSSSSSSSGESDSRSESDLSRQNGKRKSKIQVLRAEKMAQKDRAQHNSNEQGAAQEKTRRSSSSSESSSFDQDVAEDNTRASSSSSSSKSSRKSRASGSSESSSRESSRSSRQSSSSSSSKESSKSSSESSCSSSEGSCSSRKSRRSSRERSCRNGKCGSSSSSSKESSRSSSSESSSSEETDFLGDKVSTRLVFAAQAVKSNNKKQGYQATVYVNHYEDKKLDLQLVMENMTMADTSKIACLSAHVWPYELQVSLKMGKRCQDKKLDMKLSKGYLAMIPAIELKIKSNKLKAMVEKLLPDLESQFGFNSVCQKNPSDQLVLRVGATSPESVVVICKLPKETLYTETLVPWPTVISPPEHHPTKEVTTFNFLTELPSRLLRGDEAECKVGEETMTNFAHVRFNGPFNENCKTLIAQDCSEDPQFSIMTRKSKPDLPRDLYILLPAINITVTPALNSSLLVLYNGEPIDKDEYGDDKGIKIYRNESVVVVQAPHYGLENVTYDGNTLWVTVSSEMRGKTCGLCGNNDGEKRNEGRMPNQELARNNKAFSHSWLLEDSECVTGLNSREEGISQSAQQ